MKKLFIRLLSLVAILSCSSTVCFADNPLDQSAVQPSSDLIINNETMQPTVEPIKKIAFNPKRLADGPFKTWCLQQPADTLKLLDRDKLFEMWKKELDTQSSQITPEITLDFRRHEKSMSRRKNYAKNRESLAYSISYKKKLKEYYEKNKERILARQRAYRGENREQILARQRAYREENKEMIKDHKKAYYEKNKEMIRAQRKAYCEKNKEMIRIQQKAYYTEHKEQKKAYYEKNKERLKTYQKAYYIEHKEQKKAYYIEHKEWQKAYREKKKAERLLILSAQELPKSSSEDMKD